MENEKTEQSTVEIQLMQSTEDLIATAEDDLISNTIGSYQELNDYLESAKGVFIDGIGDIAGYENAKRVAKQLKSMRTDTEKYRKALTAPALKWQKDLKSVGDKIIDSIKDVESNLNGSIKDIEDKKKAEEQRVFSKRVQDLAEAGYQLAGDIYVNGVLQVPTGSITGLSEEEITYYISEGKKEQERKSEEERAKLEREQKLEAKEQELLEKERRLEELEAKLKAKEEPEHGDKNDIHVNGESINESDANVDGFLKKEDKVDVNEALEEHYQDLNVAAEAKPVDDQPQDDIADKIDESYNQGYADGFANMQMRIVELLSNPEPKFTRAQLVEWAGAQISKIDDHVD